MKKIIFFVAAICLFCSCRKWNGGTVVRGDVHFCYIDAVSHACDSSGVLKYQEVEMYCQGVYQSARTDDNGMFIMKAVAKGTYTLTTSMIIHNKTVTSTFTVNVTDNKLSAQYFSMELQGY